MSALPVCNCGCGETTGYATKRRTDRNVEVGDVLRFKKGHKTHVPLSARFPGGYRVDEHGCWVWVRSKGLNGYGVICDRGRQLLAHRVSYEIARGPIPADCELDHLCRVPLCVNPDHLEPVSHTINVRRGAHTVLTLDQAVEAQLLRGSLPARAIADRFGVNETTILRIWRGKTWKESASLAAALTGAIKDEETDR